jgi:GT2 family glycosyltransferase
LRSVYEQTNDISFEVTVIDNASSDGSAEMMKREFPQVKLLENIDNRGFATANNQGITIAHGQYILLLNSDTKVLDNAIAKTVQFADKYPEAAVVGCRVLNPDFSVQPTCFRFPSLLNMILSASYLYKIFPKSKFFGREQMMWWKRDSIKEVDVVTGCFMLVRHKAIKEIGFMDERFFVYGEETDWCYRFKKAGWKVLFTPDAQIIHYKGQSSKQISPIMALQLQGSILQFMKKHYSHIEYLTGCFLVWLFLAVRIPFWLIKAISSKGNQSSYCRMRLFTYLTAMERLTLKGVKGLCFKVNNRNFSNQEDANVIA